MTPKAHYISVQFANNKEDMGYLIVYYKDLFLDRIV